MVKNSNLNVIYFQKTIKFGKKIYNYENNDENTLQIIETDKIKKKNISQFWLK